MGMRKSALKFGGTEFSGPKVQAKQNDDPEVHKDYKGPPVPGRDYNSET